MAAQQPFAFINRMPTRNESIAVSTTSLNVSELGNSVLTKRTIITIRNTSPNAADVITINFGPSAAVAGSGIVLRQNESVTDADDGGYECYQGNINAVCATINGTISIFER